MDTADRDFLLELLRTPSPSGFEMPGQRVWAGYVGRYSDAVDVDAYGNTWATLSGRREGGPRIMLEAHADEIGYIVKHVTAEGFLRIDRIGGSDTATARGRKVLIYGDKGAVPGIIGNTAIHLRKDSLGDEKAPKISDLYIDVGADTAKAVAKVGIRVGHPAVYSDGAEFLGENRLVGRALDNRMGGFILARVLAKLSKKRPEATVIALNAVQEEIGGNGAMMATHRIHPDVAIVLDVTHATETPGIDSAVHGSVKMGDGPSVTHGTCNHPLLVQRLLKVAGARSIPIQHESSSRYSGTDTDVIFTVRGGIPSALVSLPLRYMHSIVEMCDLRDVEKVIDLLVAFVGSVSAKDRFSHQL
jgi:putative aminopeptidase FrvX